jgi:hypothetical protein
MRGLFVLCATVCSATTNTGSRRGDSSIYDDFTSRDESTWKWTDKSLEHKKTAFYLKNHSEMNATLSHNEGHGMILTISDKPCKWNSKLCKGVAMASSHVQTKGDHGYGDYEARFRAPHNPKDNSSSDGVTSYFTSGYAKVDGNWNELNFRVGGGGSNIVCNVHADKSKKFSKTVSLGFDNRKGFHTYMIRNRPTYVEFFIDSKSVYKVSTTLSDKMHTSLILRPSQSGSYPTHVMEYSYFKYTPYAPESKQSEGVAFV